MGVYIYYTNDHQILREQIIREQILTEQTPREQILTEQILTEQILTKQILTEKMLREQILKEQILTEQILREQKGSLLPLLKNFQDRKFYPPLMSKNYGNSNVPSFRIIAECCHGTCMREENYFTSSNKRVSPMHRTRTAGGK